MTTTQSNTTEQETGKAQALLSKVAPKGKITNGADAYLFDTCGPALMQSLITSIAELERERDALATALRPLVKYLDNVMANGPECDCPAEGHMCGWPALRLAVNKAREALGETK